MDRGRRQGVDLLAPPLATGLAVVVIALLLSTTPAVAQDDSPPAKVSPLPSPSAPSTGERRDLYLDMPYYLGGMEPQIVMVRGREHFEGADAERQAGLVAFLETVDADVEDLVSGYALVSHDELFSFVVGIRLRGAQPGTLAPAYLPLLLGELDEPTVTEDTIGGRDVLVVTSRGTGGEPVALFLYDEGDTLWLVQGPDDVVEVTLANLPGSTEP